MNFKRIGFAWIRCLISVSLAWAVASASVVAQPVYAAPKPKQTPGDTSVPMPVDPARCSKGDKKYIYWAAKEQVFRLPFDRQIPIYAIPDGDLIGQSLRARKEIPPPPDPNEPEGCYGNPLRGLSMPYFQQFSVRVYENLMGRPPPRSAMYFSGQADAWETEPGQGFWPGLNELLFQQRRYCRERGPGLQVCLMNDNQDLNNFIPSHVYVIPRSKLPSYAGNKDIRFSALQRLSGSSNSKDIRIQSNFKLFENVLIRLTPAILSNEVDVMAPYHAKLIQHVIDAHVPDYNWRPRLPPR